MKLLTLATGNEAYPNAEFIDAKGGVGIIWGYQYP